MRSAPFRCLVLFLFLGASACRERIQHGLDERQANELQTVLVERGLDARKVSEQSKKPTWAIEVTDAQSSDAVRILAELGLPRAATETGCDVFGGSGLIRSPLEEQVCRVRGMERELEKTLQTVDGVLLARVHLVVPPPPRPGQTSASSKASAMLRAVPGSAERVRKSADALRDLIAGGVEGLSPDAVSLLVDEVTTRVDAPPRAGPVSSRWKLVLALLGVTVTGLSGALVWATLRWRHYRILAEKPPAPPPAPPTPARPVVTPASARKLA